MRAHGLSGRWLACLSACLWACLGLWGCTEEVSDGDNGGNNATSNNDDNSNNGDDNNGDDNAGGCELGCPPPSPSCEGQFAIRYSGDGLVTEACVCDYAGVEEREDCAASGQTCAGGACVEPDPSNCEGVTCPAPGAFCDEGVAVRFEGDGSCDALTGECDYSGVEAREDCAAAQRECVDGACVDGPCTGVACPPLASRCERQVLVEYTDGLCQDGACSYEGREVLTDCGARGEVCQDGACVDLCDGVECEAPEDRCEGQTSVQHDGPGSCNPRDGECDYEAVEVRVDCAELGQICEGGRCVDLCAGVLCPAPQSFCEAQVAVSYQGAGSCNPLDGSCGYGAVERRVDCAGQRKACVEGACVDLCQGEACSPPPDACQGQVAVQHSGAGVCDPQTGLCDYDDVRVQVNCAGRGELCQDGACVPDPCEDQACAPPAPSCEGSFAVRYTGAGTCDSEDGSCDYQRVTTRTNCSAQGKVCQSGACVDPCGVGGCAAPDDVCDGERAIQYTGPGVCNQQTGVCNFAQVQTTVDCAAQGEVCQDGACVDLCQGVTCPRPSNTCDGSVSVRYTGAGACDPRDGLCDYGSAEQRTDCGAFRQVCRAGACVDLCLGVTCPSPGDYCEGEVAVVHIANGQCAYLTGQCDYRRVQARTDCSAQGQRCSLGACVDDATIQPGELVITEIMQNPEAVPDTMGEWFEVHNRTGRRLLLDGVRVTDNLNNNNFTIPADTGLWIEPRAYMVWGRNGDRFTNGGVTVSYIYNNFNLGNDSDSVVLYDAQGVELDRVEYDDGETFPDPTGTSMQLGSDASFDLNHEGASWCTSRTQYNTTDRGTPGAPNEPCAQVAQDVTVQQVQDEGALDHPPAGTFVRVEGLAVLAKIESDPITIWTQDPAGGPHAGVALFRGRVDVSGVQPGQLVNVTGIYEEFYGLARISLESLEVVGSVMVQPTTLEATSLASPSEAERWESMLVRVLIVDVTDRNPDAPNQYGEFVVEDSVRVDDLLYSLTPRPAELTFFTSISGVLHHSFGSHKIEPRSAADVVGRGNPTTFVNIQNFSVSHNPLFIQEGVVIRWTNLDSVGHNVTSGDPGDFDAGSLFDSPVLARGQTFDFLPPEAGTYRYFCRPHEATMFGYELIIE